jgi:hypothetical protein
MTTNNSINISAAGIVKYDGAGTFTGITVTQYDVLIGAASNGISSVAPGSTSGVPLISQGASSNPVFGTALIAGGGTAATSFNINGIVISGTTTTSALAALTLTNGQIVIGSTSNPPAAGTITAGTGISISNGANSITIAATGGGVTWTVVTASTQAMAVNNGYVANYSGTCVMTLPATAAVGSLFWVTGMNTALGWKIAQNAGQQIFFGTSSTTSGTGGSLASVNIYDSVLLLCNVANNSFIVLDSVGNITVV